MREKEGSLGGQWADEFEGEGFAAPQWLAEGDKPIGSFNHDVAGALYVGV